MALIRITVRKVIKLTLLFVFVVFVVFNLLVFGRGGLYWTVVDDRDAVFTLRERDKFSQFAVAADVGSIRDLSGSRRVPPYVSAFTPPSPSVSVVSLNTSHHRAAILGQYDNADSMLPELNRSLIMLSILDSNRQQTIRNVHLMSSDFGASADSVTIVIQIHKRPAYLRHLVDSLAKAQHIQDTLVVFSHDYHSSVLNKIVESIDAFPVRPVRAFIHGKLYFHE